jgi:xanthine dehydrogenase accessory factor
MMEISEPLAVRREVSFCSAIGEGGKTVEGVEAVRVDDIGGIQEAWDNSKIAVIVDPEWRSIDELRPNVMLDAILAKKNLGTDIKDAPLVIALGPGFSAGSDVHMVIETKRGHNLGRIFTSGTAAPNTGIPGEIGGHAVERVIRAPVSGIFKANKEIGDNVCRGMIMGTVNGNEIRAEVDGVLRGMIRSGSKVSEGLKVGDIDPRGEKDFCYTLSDKARAVGGSVLEAILRVYNR